MDPEQGKFRDIRVVANPKLAKLIAADEKSLSKRQKKPRLGYTGKRKDVRLSLMEPPEKDPNGWERLIGQSNLVSINFLDRGRRAADAVCMIRVPSPDEGWRGTGFLVGSRLLMTNHHVLGSRAEAAQAEAEFGYELDLDGVARQPVRFNLAPHEIFFTDRELDVTLVSVNRYSDADVPLERYGRLPLIPLSGKALHGEEVSIIQHPQGETKQIAIRASRIIDLRRKSMPGMDANYFKRFIHYSTDTQPGSSGAPVFNDNWQVIAIHHRAIADLPQAKRNRKRPGDDGPGDRWLANEGVRISAIYRKLEQSRFSDRDAAAALERLEEALGLVPLIRPVFDKQRLGDEERDRKPYALSKWDAFVGNPDFGYRPDFLPLALPLEDIVANKAAEIAPLKDGTLILPYLHFSCILHKARKFPLMTAVNIRGDKLMHPGERSSTWRRDSRIDDEFQPNEDFYGDDKGTVPVEFDRGHLVRRLDPCWGAQSDAEIADEHTFHYTNAAPQVHGYNDFDWGNLEDYVLNQAQTKEKRMTVFSGPIFRDDDPPFTLKKDGSIFNIPVSFWKIAVIEKSERKIAAVGFVLGQIKYIQTLYEARVFTQLRPYTVEELKRQGIQVPIATIEKETGLNFETLREVDALDALESTRRVRFIQRAADVVL